MKKIGAILLCAVLLCVGLPVAGLAEPTEYALWVGNGQVTSQNAADLFGDGSASFDAETNTLTLCDLEMTAALDGDPGELLDYACIYSNLPSLTIRLIGDNTLYSGYRTDGHYNQAISAAGDLIFEGDGSLLAMSGPASYFTGGIYAIGDICMNGEGNITARADMESLPENSYGIASQNGNIYAAGSASGGVIEATGQTAAFRTAPLAPDRVALTPIDAEDWAIVTLTNENVKEYSTVRLKSAYSFARQPQSGSALNGTSYQIDFGVTDFDGAAVTPTKAWVEMDTTGDGTFDTKYIEVSGSPFAVPYTSGGVTLNNTAYTWRLCAQIGSGDGARVLNGKPFTVAFKEMENVAAVTVTMATNGLFPGKTPNDVTFTAAADGDERAVKGCRAFWQKKTGDDWKSIDGDTPFEEKGLYAVTVQVDLQGGYRVTAATEGTFNGEPTDKVFLGDEASAYLGANFDPLPSRQVVKSIKVKVTDPKIGDTVQTVKDSVTIRYYDADGQEITAPVDTDIRFFRCSTRSADSSAWASMADTEEFLGQLYYSMDVNMQYPDGSLAYFAEDVLATVNGLISDMAFGGMYVADDWAYASHTWKPLPDGSTPINSVNFTATTPKIGALPDTAVTVTADDGLVNVIDVGWLKAADPSAEDSIYNFIEPTEAFEEGQRYALEMHVRVAAGYSLDLDTECTVNELPAQVNFTGNAGEYEVVYFFDALSSAPSLPGFNVELPPLYDGQLPPTYTISDTSHLSVLGFGWKRADPMREGQWLSMEPDETLREGETYAFYLWLSVGDGYVVGPDTEMRIGGKRVGVEGWIDTSFIIMREFTVTAGGEEPTVRLGDANEDESVDMKDVLLIRKHIAKLGSTLNLTNADANADGSVDMKDVLLIRKFIARLIEHF